MWVGRVKVVPEFCETRHLCIAKKCSFLNIPLCLPCSALSLLNVWPADTRTWDGCFGKTMCTRAPVCVCVFWGLGWFTQLPHSINSHVTAQNSPVCADVGLKYWADSGTQTEQCWLTNKWRPLSSLFALSFFSTSHSLVFHIYVCVSY